MGHDTHDVHGPKGKFDQIFKTAKSLKLERPQLPKLVSMCFTSTSTCMNFLIQFYFLTSMVQREIMHIGSNYRHGIISYKVEAISLDWQ